MLIVKLAIQWYVPSMRVIVTGGAGDIGRYVVRELSAAHEVIVVDRNPDGREVEGATEVRIADLSLAAEAERSITGADSVVQLAAIPRPFVDPGELVMGVNVLTVYNVLEAMRHNGIRKGVYGGSESGTGFGIHNTFHVPLYLPIDADHPCWPHESYGLSKLFGEEMFREYARAYAMRAVSLRFVWVWLERNREAIEKLIKSREEARTETLGAYVLPADVARAVRLAVEYVPSEGDTSGFAAYFVHAPQIFDPVPTLDLAARIWGAVPPQRRPEVYREDPYAPMFDVASAREDLGFDPELTWKDY